MALSRSGRSTSRMSQSVVEAVQLAQERCLTTTSAAVQHRLELALDELLRRPNADGDPAKLLDNALANARTKLRRRAAIRQLVISTPLIEDAVGTSAEATDDLETVIIEAVNVVKASGLSAADRALLLWSIADMDAATAGELLGAAPRQVRERLSRARQHARADRALRTDLAAG